MKLRHLCAFTLATCCTLPILSALAPANHTAASKPIAAQDGGEDAMKEMMAKVKKYTQPGEEHKLLERFLGKWDTVTRFTMGGSQSPGTKGTSETKWLHDGRWLQSSWQGVMMGMPVQGTSMMGYDKFKMSYVATTVSTMDTAMNTVEGDTNREGDVLILYGTIDEYLDGSHDKMSKTVYRFLGKDKILMEVHDFTIGEENTKVVEVEYTRAK